MLEALGSIAAKALFTLSLSRCLGHQLYYAQHVFVSFDSHRESTESRAATGILTEAETNPNHSSWTLASGHSYRKAHAYHFPADASCHTSPLSISKMWDRSCSGFVIYILLVEHKSRGLSFFTIKLSFFTIFTIKLHLTHGFLAGPVLIFSYCLVFISSPPGSSLRFSPTVWSHWPIPTPDLALVFCSSRSNGFFFTYTVLIQQNWRSGSSKDPFSSLFWF